MQLVGACLQDESAEIRLECHQARRRGLDLGQLYCLLYSVQRLRNTGSTPVKSVGLVMLGGPPEPTLKISRGHDSIAVYSVNEDGHLTRLEIVKTGGKEPRNFNLDPTGNFLLAENQKSDTIVVFRIDQESGKLTPTGQVVQVPTPVCIRFLN